MPASHKRELLAWLLLLGTVAFLVGSGLRRRAEAHDLGTKVEVLQIDLKRTDAETRALRREVGRLRLELDAARSSELPPKRER